MSSNIYNHRALVPQAAPVAAPSQTASSARLADLLDFVKQEFEVIGNDAAQLKGQRDEFEHRVTAQISEIAAIQQSLYELEARHREMAKGYKDEVDRLRRELEARGVHPGPPPAAAVAGLPPPASAHHGPPPSQQPAGPHPGGPTPPNVGHSGASLFGGIMGGAGQPLPSSDAQNGGPGDRERERSGMPLGGADHPSKRMRTGDPGPNPPGGPGMYGGATPPPPPMHGRPDIKPKRNGAEHGSSHVSPYASHAAAKPPPLHHDSPVPSHPAPGALPAPGGTLNSLIDLDPDDVPRELKKEGSDWMIIFNPKVERQLDVNLVHTFVHESVVCCVRFSPDGKFLATGCNKSAQIFDTKTGGKTCVLSDQPPSFKGDLYIRSVCFSPDGKYLATGAEDKQIRVWDIAKKRVRHLFQGHKQEIYSLDYSRDGRIIASGSGDKTVRIWDTETGQCLHTLYTSAGMEHGPCEAGVTSISISSDNRLVAAGALDTLVRVWDMKTGQLLERLRSHKDSIYSVAFAPDGKSLVSGSLDKTLKTWDLTATAKALETDETDDAADKVGHATCSTTFVGHRDYVLSVSCSPDGKWVASGSKDRGVQFWDPQTAQVQFVLQGHKNSVIAINLSPAGGMLATGSGDFTARVWSYARA